MSGRIITTPAGEKLPVPEELAGAITAAVRATREEIVTFAQWRTAFGDALTAALHEAGLILVARGFSTSREMVTASTYSLAVSAKNHQERKWEAARRVFAGDAVSADLHGEVNAMVDVLTGHAPHSQFARLAALDERLRALRHLFLAIPVEAEPTPLPETPVDLAEAPQPGGTAA